MHGTALQDLVIVKPLLVRADNIADFLTHRKNRDMDEMRRQRIMSQKKEKDKMRAEDVCTQNRSK